MGFVPAVGNLDLHLVQGLHSGREQPQRAVLVRFDAEVDPKVQGQILRRGAAGFFQEDLRIVNEPAAAPIDACGVDVGRDGRREMGQGKRSPHRIAAFAPQRHQQMAVVAPHSFAGLRPPPGRFTGTFQIRPGNRRRHEGHGGRVAAKRECQGALLGLDRLGSTVVPDREAKVSSISCGMGSDGVSSATMLSSIRLFSGGFSVMGTSRKGRARQVCDMPATQL